MATGTTYKLTKDWTELTADATPFVIQNVGNGLAIIKYSASEPDADAKGHECPKGEGIASNIFGEGVTWGRALVTTLVEVTL